MFFDRVLTSYTQRFSFSGSFTGRVTHIYLVRFRFVNFSLMTLFLLIKLEVSHFRSFVCLFFAYPVYILIH